MMPPMTPAYDPVGAMGGLFAPAFIAGNPTSEAAVKAWQDKNFSLTNADIEATRGPDVVTPSGGGGGIGGLYALMGRGLGGGGNTTTKGSVDPEALRVLSQGGTYDKEKRRNEIAQQVQAQAQPAAQPAAQLAATGAGWSTPNPFMMGGYAGGFDIFNR